MNINITIDITARSVRRLAALCVTLLVAGVTASANGLPVTFASHQKLTAAQLNENFGDLDGRLTAVGNVLAEKADRLEVPIVTPWQPYAPLLTTNKGVKVPNQSSLGHYRRVGDTLEVRLTTTFSGLPNSRASWWQWELPDDLIVDFQKVGAIARVSVGHGSASSSSGEQGMLDAFVRSERTISATGPVLPYVADTAPIVFDDGALVSLDFKVPIEGWSVTE